MHPVMHLNICPHDVVVMKEDKEEKLEAWSSVSLLLWGLVVKWGAVCFSFSFCLPLKGKLKSLPFLSPSKLQSKGVE
eukprot:3097833-Ditylum_brightwellii.AAC.1